MKRVLLFLALATVAYADRLPDWLRLPAVADPRPTGASAWVLHDATILTQERPDLVRRRRRYAHMTLSRAGVKNSLSLEQFTTGVEKLVFAKAWVCSPDGKSVREFGGADFFTVSPTISRWTWDQTTNAYFNPERFLEVGWVFAFEVEIQSEYAMHDYRWQPGSDLPVRSASLEIIPMPGGSVKARSFPENAFPTGGGNSWRVSDLAPNQPDVPAGLQRQRPELCVYLIPTADQNPVTNTWANAATLVRAQMDPKIQKTSEIAAEANRVVGRGNLWERIEPVCRFVQKEVPYLSVYIMTDSLAGYRPHSAAEVLANRYGDCKDKAVLLCSMLDVVGVEARVVLVNSNYPRHNRPEWPSIQFNHAVVAIRATEPVPAGWTTVKSGGAEWVLFDPTNDEIPLGLFPPYNTGGLGLVLAPGVDAPVEIPAIASPTPEQSIEIELQLADDGSAKVSARETRTGLTAADSIHNEETVQQWERRGAYERRITRRLPLAKDLNWSTTKDAKANVWTSHATFEAPSAGKRISRSTLSVSTDLLSAVPDLTPWEEGSEGWVNVTPRAAVRKVTLTPPAGTEFVDVPEDWTLATPAGESSVRIVRTGDKLTVESSLRLTGGVLDRAAYNGTRDLLRATLAAERRPILIRRPTPPAPAPAATKS